MTQFTTPEIWKRHAVLFGIQAGSSHTKISECLDVNLRTEQSSRKELDESNGNDEGMAARKPYSDRPDKKRIPEFVGEIQAMINNNPSKSVRSIARDMEVSEFLIALVINESIRYFSYNMRKGQGMSALQNFLTHSVILLRPNMLCFSSDEEKFLPGSDGELTEQPLVYSVPTRYTDIGENQTPSPHHSVWNGH